MRNFLFALMFMCCGSGSSSVESAGLVMVREIVAKCDADGNCETALVGAGGSAVRIVWDGEFYWLTAGHVCAPLGEKGTTTILRSMTVTPLGLDPAKSIPIEGAVYRDDIDLCLLPAQPGMARVLGGRDLRHGERLHTFAFPGNGYSTELYPLYEGTFNGKISPTVCVTSVPVAPGSSGAGILDRHGRVVGIVTSVMASFNHFSMFSCPDATVWFVNEAAALLRARKAAE